MVLIWLAVLEAVQRLFGVKPEPLAHRVPADNTSFPDGVRLPTLASEPGQMGTDIRLDAYEPIISEIRAEQPDVVIWLMEWHAAASYPHDA